MMLPGRFLLALALLLIGCAQAPPPPPPKGLASLDKARQFLSAGQPAQAAEAARQAISFLEVQDRSRVPEAQAVLAESSVQLQDYSTALKYYQLLATTDARTYGPPYARLCSQLARPKLEAAKKLLVKARKGTSFERTNQLLEAGEALGQAQELLNATDDKLQQAEAQRLGLQLARDRNRILPSARPAPGQKRRKDPFGAPGAAVKAGKPIFTKAWHPPLPIRQGDLELTEFVITPGLLGVSRIRGTVVNYGSPVQVELKLRMLAEETYRGLMDTQPEALADDAALARRASVLTFPLGSFNGAKTFEEKVETGLPISVSLFTPRSPRR